MSDEGRLHMLMATAQAPRIIDVSLALSDKVRQIQFKVAQSQNKRVHMIGHTPESYVLARFGCRLRRSSRQSIFCV